MKDVPEYDNFMYLKGYTPAQIKYAHRKMMLKQIEEREQNNQLEKEVERQLAEIIEKALDELLKDFGK